MSKFDVDIDVKDNRIREEMGVVASIIERGEWDTTKPHPSGVYINYNIPVDKETGRSALDYKEAEELGFVKVDILTNSFYTLFRDKEELLHYKDMEMDWDTLLDVEIVSQLPHIHNHFDIVTQIKPQSIQDLADILALIRPGNRNLLNDYLQDKERIRKILYIKKGEYTFKKSHAISLSILITIVAKKITDNGSLDVIW